MDEVPDLIQTDVNKELYAGPYRYDLVEKDTTNGYH